MKSFDPEDTVALFTFFAEAQKLKTTVRHSWIGQDSVQESSAEHTWMLCLIAVTLFPYLTIQVDQLKVLKMIIIHDLAEAVVGDIPYFEQTGTGTVKEDAERDALTTMLIPLRPILREEIVGLWEEFEERATLEAKMARGLDKYEALLSHNLASMSSWSDGDYSVVFSKFTDDTLFEVDPCILALKRHIDKMNLSKIQAAGTEDRLNAEYTAHYFPQK
jgi:putative hydrolase of HD superfamily